MKKIIFLVFILALAWFAWPFYSMYGIYSGMKNNDIGLLERKIHWTGLTDSAKPVVSGEVDRAIDQAVAQAGPLGMMIKANIGDYKEELVDTTVKSFVSPKGLVKVYEAGGDVTSVVMESVSKQIAKISKTMGESGGSGSSGGGGLGSFLGGLTGGNSGLGALISGIGKQVGSNLIKNNEASSDGGPDSQQQASAPGFGLSNVKHFSYGLTNMEIGISRKPDAEASDVIAVMEFMDWDWKLTKIRRP